MEFYSPKNFKSASYYFGKYDAFDLCILIPSIILGIFIVLISATVSEELNTYILICGVALGVLVGLTGFILTYPIPIYHNMIGYILCFLNYSRKQKSFKWLGFNYNNYED